MQINNDIDYKMFCLYQLDLLIAIRDIEAICPEMGDFICDALWRDAVVSYCRPFGKNNSEHGKHKLSIDCVPLEYIAFHEELIRVRDSIVAHTDYSQVSQFTVGGELVNSNISVLFSTFREAVDFAHMDANGEGYKKLFNAVFDAVNNSIIEYRRTEISGRSLNSDLQADA